MNGRLRKLAEAGQSVWIDSLSRDDIKNGSLERMIENAVVGVTSNPTIFQKGISHSMHLLAVALLDGEVYPAQYAPERISADDVQGLLRKVGVRPAGDLSERFPREMPCRIRVSLRGGRTFEREKRDYEGFSTRPISWERALEKFERLATPYADGKLRGSIAFAVRHVEDVEVRELAGLLGKVGTR